MKCSSSDTHTSLVKMLSKIFSREKKTIRTTSVPLNLVDIYPVSPDMDELKRSREKKKTTRTTSVPLNLVDVYPKCVADTLEVVERVEYRPDMVDLERDDCVLEHMHTNLFKPFQLMQKAPKEP